MRGQALTLTQLVQQLSGPKLRPPASAHAVATTVLRRMVHDAAANGPLNRRPALTALGPGSDLPALRTGRGVAAAARLTLGV